MARSPTVAAAKSRSTPRLEQCWALNPVRPCGWRIAEAVSLREINFDGIIGPSHNYAGLSLGNLASARNAGDVSEPRAAALQGLEKMRANLELGLAQGIFLPHRRPDRAWLAALGTSIEGAEPAL